VRKVLTNPTRQRGGPALRPRWRFLVSGCISFAPLKGLPQISPGQRPGGDCEFFDRALVRAALGRSAVAPLYGLCPSFFARSRVPKGVALGRFVRPPSRPKATTIATSKRASEAD
jgi:hypothetical protein